MQARLKTKIAGFGLHAAADYLRLPSVAWWPQLRAQSEISKPNPYRARNR
jgi:hypothetical protein